MDGAAERARQRPSATVLGDAVPELVQLLLSRRKVDVLLDSLAGGTASVLGVSCGVTMSFDGHPVTVASSDAFARALDEMQYGEGVGPCLQAMSMGEQVHVPDVRRETRWDGYPAKASAFGAGSSLSLPLVAAGRPLGALNMYSRAVGAFGDRVDFSRALAVAAQGGAVLGIALRQVQQAHLNEQLREALNGRGVIDQAIGVVMAQQRCNAATAFGILRTASQGRNRKLRDISVDVVTAVGGPPTAEKPFDEPLR